MDNYNNLSKEKLISLLTKQKEVIDSQNKELISKNKELSKKNKQLASKDKQIASKDKQIVSQDKLIVLKQAKIEKLEVDNRNLNLRIEQLIAKYEDKLLASKKFQVEQFIPKSEKLKEEDLVFNELEVIKEKQEKKTRKAPTENFINDLKKLCDK